MYFSLVREMTAGSRSKIQRVPNLLCCGCGCGGRPTQPTVLLRSGATGVGGHAGSVRTIRTAPWTDCAKSANQDTSRPSAFVSNTLTHTPTYAPTRTQAFTHTRTRARSKQTRARARAHTHTHTRTHARARTHACTHTHTHTHTHLINQWELYKHSF